MIVFTVTYTNPDGSIEMYQELTDNVSTLFWSWTNWPTSNIYFG